MKFAWPESQKRESLKWGNMASAPGTGGSVSAGESAVAGASCLLADGTSACCEKAGSARWRLIITHNAHARKWLINLASGVIVFIRAAVHESALQWVRGSSVTEFCIRRQSVYHAS